MIHGSDSFTKIKPTIFFFPKKENWQQRQCVFNSSVEDKKNCKLTSIVVKQWGADISGLGGVQTSSEEVGASRAETVWWKKRQEE